ncbi:MAG: FkbM family methyltransferase [Flammeovirgaceae bacterium]|nr:FkbM family methyltransferase [Flammeovirgaceae bacterium]
MKSKKEIHQRLKAKGVEIDNVCEVGVYMPETSNIIDFIEENIPTMLVEPDPKSIHKIKEIFGAFPHVALFPFAIYDYNGKLSLSQANASTFVSELKASPALVNDKYEVEESKNFEVNCKKFSEIDHRNIDLISIDIEGSEWYVLKYIKSRPRVISIETHGKFYQNPFINEISTWIDENDYEVWYKDNSDTVYIKKGLFEISLGEKLGLKIKETRIALRKAKKIFRG